MITALLAQGYNSFDAALLGVYLHGLAADIASKSIAMEAMLAGDVIGHISDAFLAYRSDYFQTRRPVLWAALLVSLPASSGTWLINS